MQQVPMRLKGVPLLRTPCFAGSLGCARGETDFGALHGTGIERLVLPVPAATQAQS